jgi:hypothetical protein
MKAVLVIYGASLDEKIMETLTNLEIKQFTKSPYLLGRGGTSDPHLNTSIWPGSNMAILLVVEEETKTKVMAAMKALKEQHHQIGLKAMVMPIEEII